MSLAALWVFAAWVTMREGLNLLTVTTLDQNVTRPAVTLVTEVQQERRLSLAYLGSPSRQQRAALDAQRQRVDSASADYREGVASGSVSRMASDNTKKSIKESLSRLNALTAGRTAIDARSLERGQAAQPYNDFIDVAFRLYTSVGSVDDDAIAKDSRTLNSLTRAKEILSREDALLAGALAAGRFTPAEHAEFTKLVGTQRFLHEEAAAELPQEDRAQYDEVARSNEYLGLRGLEDRIVQSKTTGPIRITSQEWESSMLPVQKQLEQVVLDGGDRLLERAKPMGYGIIIRLALAGGLGLLAVIASIVVSITTARALVRQLERLRAAAWELAEQRLPGVVERLGHGEQVDVSLEAPPLQFGNDEIGQVGRAFNAVQETAIRTAVEQAELRRGIRDVLLSLARRTQTLVHRQLTMLDTMERRHDIEVKELEELFRLDHLATRMRRNAENLIVLSGALPARGWRNSVPMVDVVRAAVGEVEDYTRVTVLPFGPVELAGRAVGDVTHLLAELIENAVSFSPPDTVVQIGGHLVASGFAIDIEDRGLGMTDEKLAEINARIADPPDFNLQSSVQLGLFVVSKLAERYNVQVSLKRSAYGGTTAVVVIPRELISEQGPEAAKSGATTQNGLEVRQPTVVGAPANGRPVSQNGTGADAPASGPRSSGATATLSASSTGPALVAVPSPASEPADAHRPGGGGRSPEDAAPEDGGDSVTTEPEDQPPVPDSSTTPSGLPVRVPQANLAEPLRAGEPAAEEQEEVEDPGRSPEEIQRIMGSYQRGTRQGRSDAAQAERQERRENAAEGEEDQ
ncbi:nitrate- and nitrite sensing domain-containing protein [Actinomadura sp. GC306]|uniref:sensor histidine kinase n=1 Tax=Actinomadura sp. GC306 TaxID=2530367 RepID=UPI001FB800AB|nr:nitrate- and nitrite sensing domain-containing protein [Actinomadura sp. GC306]